MMQPEAFALLNHDGVALVENGVATSYAELAALAVEYGRRLGTERRLVFLETCNSVHAVGALLGCLIGGHVVHPFAAGESHLASERGPVFQPNVRLSFTQGQCDLVWMHDRSLDLHPDLRILLSTSGSTGAPKLVKLSETNLLSNAAAIAEYLQLGPGERAATTLDFAHAFGLSVLTSHLHSGGSLLLTSQPITDPGFWTRFRAGEIFFEPLPQEIFGRASWHFAGCGLVRPQDVFHGARAQHVGRGAVVHQLQQVRM